MSDTRQFWILRWPNGAYYSKGEHSGWETIKETSDPLRAVRFHSFESARYWHDSRGHFFHQPMVAVGVKLTVEPWHEVMLPALERSTEDDDG